MRTRKQMIAALIEAGLTAEELKGIGAVALRKLYGAMP